MSRPTARDRHWLNAAVDLSRLSPPSPSHYAVGAALVAGTGELLATGYTAEGDPHHHAEEAALAKLGLLPPASRGAAPASRGAASASRGAASASRGAASASPGAGAARSSELGRATLYTSLEPCTVRKSRPTPCAELILTAGIGRVVLALREPLLFADCDGVAALRRGGVEVIEIVDLGHRVREINAHLLGLATAS
jgi:diaminohydroxyphosphoribosylaminopyrimidine deaminase/5-amino-6-(5-phosphoribosylamino)uracil reductase